MSRSQAILQISREFSFEAAHLLPHLPANHKCSRLHGHSFKFHVILEGPRHPQLGWVMDYGEIRAHVQPLVDEFLDHRYLNEIEGLENPTSENLAVWLWERILPRLPGLVEIEVCETCQTSCSFRGGA